MATGGEGYEEEEEDVVFVFPLVLLLEVGQAVYWVMTVASLAAFVSPPPPDMFLSLEVMLLCVIQKTKSATALTSQQNCAFK